PHLRARGSGCALAPSRLVLMPPRRAAERRPAAVRQRERARAQVGLALVGQVDRERLPGHDRAPRQLLDRVEADPRRRVDLELAARVELADQAGLAADVDLLGPGL